MKIYNYPEKQDWPAIIGRQKAGPSGQVKDTVSRILSDIRTGGDIKVLEYVKALGSLLSWVHDDSLRSALRSQDFANASVKAFFNMMESQDFSPPEER